MLERKVLEIAFCLADHLAPVGSLSEKYRNIPMPLADACLVRMSELNDDSSILTVDADFRIYRKNKRRTIPLLLPPDVPLIDLRNS